MESRREKRSPSPSAPVTRDPGEIVLRAEPVAPPAIASETHDLESNRQARTKPEMFPYGVNWWMVAFAIVVVVCLVVIPLVAIFSPKYPRRGSEQARVTGANADISALTLAIEQLQIDTGQYPSTNAGLDSLLQQPMNMQGWAGPYVKRIPADPWQTPYKYLYPGVHNTGSYDLSSAGPDKKFGTSDDVRNW